MTDNSGITGLISSWFRAFGREFRPRLTSAVVAIPIATLGLAAFAAQSQANPVPQRTCRGFHYKGAAVKNLIVHDVLTCRTATALAKRYYDLAKPNMKPLRDHFGGSRSVASLPSGATAALSAGPSFARPAA
jgi:hypothetical protein